MFMPNRFGGNPYFYVLSLVFMFTFGCCFAFIETINDYVIPSSVTGFWILTILLSCIESYFLLKYIEEYVSINKIFLFFLTLIITAPANHILLTLINSKLDFSSPEKIQFKVAIKTYIDNNKYSRGPKTTTIKEYLMIPDVKKDSYIEKRINKKFLDKFHKGDLVECSIKSGLLGFRHFYGDIKLIKTSAQLSEEAKEDFEAEYEKAVDYFRNTPGGQVLLKRDRNDRSSKLVLIKLYKEAIKSDK